MSRNRTLIAAALALCVGAVVLAAPQAVQRIQAPQVRVPTVEVPQVGDAKAPQAAAPSRGLTLPALPKDLLDAYTQAGERKLPYLPGRVLVRFRPGVGRDGQARALAVLASRPRPEGLEWIGDVAIVKHELALDTPAVAEQFRARPEVEFVQLDYLMKPHVFLPNDPSFNARQWNFDIINMPRTWDYMPGGSPNTIVAVVDTGVTSVPAQSIMVKTWNGSAIVDYALPVAPSPDFTLSRFFQPRDFTVSTVSPGLVVVDTDGHGTHVAGTIGENTNNGIALAGIAFNVRIMPLKACRSFWDAQFARSAAGEIGFAPSDADGCPTSATAAAIRFAADNGAHVINYSVGGPFANPVVRSAMEYAVAKGVFIAMSNGNTFNEGNAASFPASYAPLIDGAVSVAATNRSDRQSFYSTTGDFTEVAAPGGDSADRVWQVTVLQTDVALPPGLVFPRADRYAEAGFIGTSMASPHVAGVAALLHSRGITGPAQIERLLRGSALDLGTIGRDNTFGSGRIRPLFTILGLGISR